MVFCSSSGEAPFARDASTIAFEYELAKSNPLYRLPITFVEMFPVGVVISLISAVLLRNSRFLPARSPA